MSESNIFHRFIKSDQQDKSQSEETDGTEETLQESSAPENPSSWDSESSLTARYRTELQNAGYTHVQVLVTANKEEIHDLTGIPLEHAEQIINQAKKWYDFDFQTAASVLNDRSLLVRIPTGSTAFDRILGGGIEPRSITEFYGAFTTGKTQMCMQLAVNTVHELDGDVIYIDTEGSFRPERIMQICKARDIDPQGILDRILVGRAHNTDIQMQLAHHVIQIAKERQVKLLVVDSLTSTFRAEYVGKGALMDRQQKLNQHIRQLSRVADMFNIAVVITNQVLSVISGFENTILPVGGNILAHGSTHRIHFIKSKKRPSVRYAKIVASPSLPDADASFEITGGGIRDAQLNNFSRPTLP
ncbi:MAG: DNA repair and recombination protein RadA [Candidatus Kariarchaeaceae archaeon]|jgi:DNA repair protein RadA